MALMSPILKRRSIRSYLDKKVEDEKLSTVLEAARLAPSAKNRQEWRFIVVKDAARKEKLVKAAGNQEFIAEADVIIAACGLDTDYHMTCGHPGFLVDVSIAMDHLTLQAAEEGLGTCWIGAFQQKKVQEILGVPDKASVVALTPLGYPAEEAKPRKRKKMSSIVFQEEWGRPFKS